MSRPDPTDNGGPAFPSVEHVCGEPWETTGMSLRDYFAAKAMATYADRMLSDQKIAEMSYSLADAMLAERAKGGTI